MDITYFRHLSDSRYCFSLDESHAVIRLAVSKQCKVDEAEVIYGDPMTFSRSHEPLKMEVAYEDKAFLYYESLIRVFPMRLMYIFHLRIEGKDYFLTENDIYDGFDYSLAFMCAFQFVGENCNDFIREKKSWEGRVIYQIFPERFAYREGAMAKDYVNLPWDCDHLAGKRDAFLGGDLYGVIDRLDYLLSLGIGAIYLTPIHPSSSNHKYDVLDYFDVDSSFGGKEAFGKLIEEAHKRDIKVMMDLVFNHCSFNHPFFVDAYEKGRNSKYYDWFFIRGEKVSASPLNYACFGYVKTMPKLNTNNKEVQAYLIEVGKYWLKEFDVDGYRLDVSEGVSHDFWNRFKIACKDIKEDILVIGENWLNSESYLGNNQFDGVMNYPFLSAVSGYVLKQKNAAETAYFLQGLLMRYKDGHNRMMMNILSSHDIQRFYTLVNESKDLSLIGFAIMIFYLGYPLIYYGEEIFMTGGRDPDNRKGMRWDSKEFDSSYHKAFASLIALRKRGPLAKGNIRIEAKDGLLKIKRALGEEAYSLYCNLTSEEKGIVGEPILSNRLNKDVLAPDGFAIIQE